jgi:isopentenyl phosphate kinase
MGNLEGVTVLKLGGSLVTHKDVPMSINQKAIRNVARAISHADSSKSRLVLIHGGGSFGHYNAKKYGLSSERRKANPLGVAKTNAAMLELHSSILNELVDSGVNAETISPYELLSPDLGKLSRIGRERLRNCFARGLVPISFGIVHSDETGSRIISGDLLAETIANDFEAKRVIFAMDVDGVYSSYDLKGEIIKILKERSLASTAKRTYDVTGGIQAKINLGFKLAEKGSQVIFVNGLKYDRLAKLLQDGDPEKIKSTVIMPAKQVH